MYTRHVVVLVRPAPAHARAAAERLERAAVGHAPVGLREGGDGFKGVEPVRRLGRGRRVETCESECGVPTASREADLRGRRQQLTQAARQLRQ